MYNSAEKTLTKYNIDARVELRESIFPLCLHFETTQSYAKYYLEESPCFSMNSVTFSENVS